MKPPAPATPHADPAWRGRLLGACVAVALLGPMLVASEFKPWVLFDRQSLAATMDFLSGFARPAHSAEFLHMALLATWQTVAMATAGLTLALAGVLLPALVAAGSLSISRIGGGRMHPVSALVRQAVRWLLVLLRSVPELVWALLLVRILGLGPAAGVLALALTYCGMLGKVYAEIIESCDPAATDALLRNGSPRLAALLYGTLPQAAPELLSYTVYRWECAVRGSVVMGFVGAGGLGQRMDESMKMLAGDEVASMLLIFALLVAAADGVSKLLRRSLG